jgi:hypothetical protein
MGNPDKAWSGLRLLVPMKVEALVVTNDAKQKMPWCHQRRQYANLKTFQNVETAWQVGPLPSDFPTGIILHWALPDGYSRGRVSRPNGPMEFPLIPNRWLVRRTLGRGAATAPAPKSWVIESDYLGEDGSNEFLIPGTKDFHTQTRLGRALPLEQWPDGKETKWPADLRKPGRQGLRATGLGEPAFPAYVPNIRNVLSYHDELRDISGTDLRISYTVLGWYADPEDDPLHNAWNSEEEWSRRLAELGWTVSGKATAADAWRRAHPETPVGTPGQTLMLPAQTISHGAVFEVPWPGPDGRVYSGIPFSSTLPDIALGHNTADALAAFARDKLRDGATTELVLRALQYDLVEQLERGGREVEAAARRTWFGTTDGGRVWVLRAPPSKHDGSIEATPTNAQDGDLLRQLNEAQRQLDRADRQREFLREEVYGAWWRLGQVTSDETALDQDEEAEQEAKSKAAEIDLRRSLAKLRDEEVALAAARERRDSLREALQSSVQGRFALEEIPAPAFYHPTEPLVLFHGAGRSAKYSDASLRKNGLLPCRFSGQTLNGISFPPGSVGEVTLDASELDMGLLPARPEQPLPSEVQELVRESWLLDSGNAPTIAAILQKKRGTPEPSTETVRKQQTLYWNAVTRPDVVDPATTAELSGLRGTLPSPVSTMPWSPPWSPLYLVWRFRWAPTGSDADPLAGWVFDGTDFQLTARPSGVPTTIEGHALLTSQTPISLSARLKAFVAREGPATSAPKDVAQQLRQLSDDIGDWDVISQVADGFNSLLVGREPGFRPRPGKEKVGEEEIDLGALLGGRSYRTPVEQDFFSPLRAGTLGIDDVFIVDDFGQVLSFKNEAGQQAVSAISAAGLALPSEKPQQRMLVSQLAPRIQQDARLRFDFVSSTREDWLFHGEGDVGVNPVCGWVMPVNLSQALLVFDAEGRTLGELLVVGDRNNPRLGWQPFPGMAQSAVGAPSDIRNPHLLAFVQGLLNHEAGGEAALRGLLDAIDATRWTMVQLPVSRSIRALATLVGEPLALVRTRVQLELATDRLRETRFPALDGVKHPYSQARIPIRLGNLRAQGNGLIGWFNDTDYTRFQSLVLESGMNELSYATTGQDLRLSLDDRDEARLTLLVDPRGEIHANCGLLPTYIARLPDSLVQRALANMELTFRAGPVLSAENAIRMRVPTGVRGSWEWLQRADTSTWHPPKRISQGDAAANFPTGPLTLRQGWLKLAGAMGKRDSEEE